MKPILLSVRTLCLAFLTVLAAPVLAQSFPSQPIRLIIAYPPGGAVDTLARHVGAAITEKTGQPVLVESKAGGATTIAAQALASARPDGYTVAFFDPSTVALNPHLFKKLSYDPTALVPVTTLIRFQLALLVANQAPFQTLKDYVDAAKAKPRALACASTGAGNPTHLTMERFKLAAGIDVNHVPYRGGAPALQDLVGGQVESAFMDLASAVPLIKSGQVRVLAVTPTRSDIVPNVPTFAEIGYPNFSGGAWSGVFAPPGTPPAVVSQLNRLFREAAASPKVLSWIKSVSLEQSSSTPTEFAKLIKTDSENYGAVIKRINFTLD